MKNTKVKEIVKKLIDQLDKEKLNANDIVLVTSTFLFSVGFSLENIEKDITAEEVLTNFALTPTLGNALMAQALHMKETWVIDEREETHDRTESIIQGKTED